MITADAQQLEPGGRVTVYELDASSFGADQLFFHQHLQTGVIWWQGQEYGAWPIEATGFERTSDQPPNPRLRVSNLDGRIGALCLMFDDMVGARIIRRQTLVKYLDVKNFPAQNYLRQSNNPTTATWASNGTVTRTALPERVIEGVPFKGISLGSVSNNWDRIENVVVGGVVPGDVIVATSYIGLSVQGSARIMMRSATTTDIQSIVSFVRQQSGKVTWSATTGFGATDVLEIAELEPNVFKIVIRWTVAVAGPTARLGFGPNATGRTMQVYGAQIEKQANPQGFFVITGATAITDGYNPTADPNEHFLDEIWFIERKVSEDNETVEFELATAIDLNGEQLPGRQIIAGTCGWLIRGGYRGPYCTYNGSAYFDINDNPVSDPARDVCAGLVRSCKKRFGETNPLPYGGFPAAGLLRT